MATRFTFVMEDMDYDQFDTDTSRTSFTITADELPVIFDAFAEFLRRSGFDYVRYIGDEAGPGTFCFDKRRYEDYGAVRTFND